jgi:hypothetical protein
MFSYDIQASKLSSQGLTSFNSFHHPTECISTAISFKQEGIVTFMTTNKTLTESHLINMINLNWSRSASQLSPSRSRDAIIQQKTQFLF